MRLSDRYILREFLQALGYCLAAFVLMRVVYELFQTLREFLGWGSSILTMAKYYLLIVPGAVAVTLPAAVFFGLLFTLVTMSKNNELTALRAAGCSLLRSCAPIVAVSLVLTGLLLLLNEMVVPAANGEAARLHDMQKALRKVEKGMVDSSQLTFVRYSLTYVNDREKRTWFFGSFNTKTLSAEHVIVDCRPRGLPEQSINAQFAYWVGSHWLFQNVKVITYAPNGEPSDQVTHSLWEPVAINDLPEDIVLYSKEEPEFMTLRQLRRYLKLHPGEKLAKFRVNYQQRYAYPWACLVACLMAIPLGAGTGRRSALVGVTVALALFVFYFVVYYAGLTLGKQGALNHIVAAWMANGVFMLMGLVMMWRVR
ncbi:MAG: YjgP/YjgQ family permease [Verrucomicrobia bacterium]|nr:YjgP/YjgQ family permease [Verrucomicrobiota bacterium]